MDRKKYRILHNVQSGKLVECAFFESIWSVWSGGFDLSLMSFIKTTSMIDRWIYRRQSQEIRDYLKYEILYIARFSNHRCIYVVWICIYSTFTYVVITDKLYILYKNHILHKKYLLVSRFFLMTYVWLYSVIIYTLSQEWRRWEWKTEFSEVPLLAACSPWVRSC